MNPGLARLVDALEPGATPVSLRRLKGGLGARMHVLRYEALSGERRNVVLRRSKAESRNSSAERVRRLFANLEFVQQAGIPAPQPLLLDAEGGYVGGPAIVMSYIPGRPMWTHPQPDVWAADLANAAASIHSMTPHALRNLPSVSEQLNEYADRARNGEPLARQALHVLEVSGPRIAATTPCLVHNDFWPGNTIWRRGRLVAVIDWADAGLGDRREDVAQCRADMTVSHGIDAADEFLRCYRVQSLMQLDDMWFYDLHRGLLALLFYESWLRGYHDGGVHGLTVEAAGKRIRQFVERALAEAP